MLIDKIILRLIRFVRNTIQKIFSISTNIVYVFIIFIFIGAILSTLITGLATMINLAWFGYFESFLAYEIFFVEWYATFAYYFFICGIILSGIITLIRSPILIILVWPLLTFIYFAVQGGIDIINIIVLTDGVGEFGKPLLEAIVYSFIGPSTLIFNN